MRRLKPDGLEMLKRRIARLAAQLLASHGLAPRRKRRPQTSAVFEDGLRMRCTLVHGKPPNAERGRILPGSPPHLYPPQLPTLPGLPRGESLDLLALEA